VELDLRQLRAAFQEEAEENLALAEQTLVALEGDPDDAELVHTLFRAVHTLKGGAAMAEYPSVATFAHGLEDQLDRLRSDATPVTPSLITLLLNSVDALRAELAAAIAGRAGIEPATSSLLDSLGRGLTRREAGSRRPKRAGAEPVQPPASAPSAAGPSPEGRQPPAAGLVPQFDDPRKTGTLRVAIEKLDRLLNLTGELAINRGRLGQLLDAGLVEASRDAFREADRLFADLQQMVMQARMVPLDSLFYQQRRVVRDQAAALGKRARLVIEGEDVEVDTRIAEHIRDPLMHLIRNALDHGLEAPEARRSLGKPPCGTISLRAAHQAGSIVIEVADDGAGVDLDKVWAHARTLALMTGKSRPTDQELLRVILEPGFSTAERVTGLSGRGVGLDVVRRNVETLRGSLGVKSQRGAGTTVTVRLPLTLAVIAGFVVKVAAETYIVPLERVLECIEMPSGVSFVDGSGVTELRGRALPLVRLRDQLGLAGPQPGREHVVVVEHEGLHAGLVVDQLEGGRQTVVKPFGRFLRGTRGLMGSAIEGDGSVSLILDVGAIVRGAVEASRGAATEAVPGPSESRPRIWTGCPVES
jgi:two-component system, chemotaxis family, sensor kinase CheA